MTMNFGRFGRIILAGLAAISLSGMAEPALAKEPLAKDLFGGKKLPADTQAATYGFYSKGCFSGGMAIATDGPTWQAMRLSRNRRWGHPSMIQLVEQFSRDATKVGWPGLLIGDISQPRGGPMLSGHASHQVGLDADIWFTPMPKRTLTRSERESISAVSMVSGEGRNIRVNDKWTESRTRLLRLAASYPQVERIFVNPAIKKKLCDTVTGDRSWLKKVRPIYGHDYHFHIRIGCQPGSSGCKQQEATPNDEGCGKSLAWWFTEEPWRPAKPGAKPAPRPRDVMTMASLPKACTAVLNAPNPPSEEAVTLHGAGKRIVAAPVEEPPAADAFVAEPQSPVRASASGGPVPKVDIPIPTPRP